MTLGRPRHHHRRTDSTNARARELIRCGAPHGTLVTAAEQTAGRGRQGRSWSAPAGQALLLSLILRAPVSPLTGLAAALAVAEIAGQQAQIKWPNDVVIGTRKLAGILIEARPHEPWAILGIGINAAVQLDELPAELRDGAATLGLAVRELEPLLERLLLALERWLAAGGETIVAAHRERDALAGAAIVWQGERWRADGIEPDGRLRVTGDSGRSTLIAAGEVHLGSAEEARLGSAEMPTGDHAGDRGTRAPERGHSSIE